MKLSSMNDGDAGLAQRLKAAALPGGRKVRRLPLGQARGCRMEIDFATDTRLFLGLYEVEMNRPIRALCRRGDRCLDIGAASGYESLAMARLGAAAVIAFEVRPESVAVTRRNLAANPQLATAFTIEEAYVSDRTAGREVAIDDYLAARPGFVPDFVKIDIEGAEARALEGMAGLLGGRRPSLVIETHGVEVEADCVRLLRGHGYDPKVVNPRRWLPDLRPLAHNRWLIARGAAG
jgi:hypothetical protein